MIPGKTLHSPRMALIYNCLVVEDIIDQRRIIFNAEFHFNNIEVIDWSAWDMPSFVIHLN